MYITHVCYNTHMLYVLGQNSNRWYCYLGSIAVADSIPCSSSQSHQRNATANRARPAVVLRVPVKTSEVPLPECILHLFEDPATRRPPCRPPWSPPSAPRAAWPTAASPQPPARRRSPPSSPPCRGPRWLRPANMISQHNVMHKVATTETVRTHLEPGQLLRVLPC